MGNNIQLTILKNKHLELNKTHKPVFYRLTDLNQKENFNTLLSNPGITLIDFLDDQLKELIKTQNPTKKYTSDQLEIEIKKRVGNISSEEYGVWVYYPWSNRLVHILDEEEFVEVRTSRNQYKITKEERDFLATKKIGVIGLSVGQSVSVTLAMERGCGELRLADFDILELTNLNRIRTGIHNLGLAKVYSVAREIAEIDPFLKVVCFPDGITETNIDDFFINGGKLDLLIEESDGFDIKILSRYKARELKIPVLMEASDKCMIDVERFDLEPERNILHGLVDHLDISTLKTLKTNEQKIPYMLDVLGIDTASLRLKASMLEIEQTITTWPQLASAVTMGGGITADVSRRLLLNQYTESGRYFVDIEELICNKNKSEKRVAEENKVQIPTLKDLYDNTHLKIEEGQIQLSKKEIENLVIAACLAPSGGNSQPWRWLYKNDALYLYNGFDANSTILGYDNLSSYIAFGAAIENLLLAASEMNFKTQFSFFPDQKNKNLIAAFTFLKDNSVAKFTKRTEAITYRLTNRRLGERVTIDTAILEKLTNAAKETTGAHLRFFTDEKDLAIIADLLGELEKIRLMDDLGHKDFVEEMRWTEEENNRKRDGVDFRTLDLTNAEKVGLQLSTDAKIIELLNKWKGGGAFKKLTKKAIDASGAVGIITMNGATHEDYIDGGRVMQRVWLEANLSGISFQPTASSVFIYSRLLKGNGIGLSPSTCEKLIQLRPLFEKTFLIPKNSGEIFIFRLCKADEPKVKSLRKPLEEMLAYY